MEKHKLNIFPEMTGEDLQRLKNELQSYGYDKTQPIITYEGCILDGWNRYKICKELDLEPNFRKFLGEDMEALEFVMRTNKRRNLSSSQWAVIAMDNEELVNKLKEEGKQKQGERTDLTSGNLLPNVEQGRTSEKLADMFNTNKQYIKEVAKIKQTDPEAIEKIRSGEKTITEYNKDLKKIEMQNRFFELQEVEYPKTTEYGSNMYVRPQVYNETRDFGTEYVVDNYDMVRTICTISRFFHKDGSELSLREYANYQGFPEDYKFVGSYQDIKTQIGNAVNPLMGKYVSKELEGKTCGDLFAGCGGFSEGLGMNGIKTKWAVEWEEIIATTYKMNHPDTKVYRVNIKHLDPKTLEKVDVIVGGPPCQGFSRAKTYTFLEDPRNELYKEFVRVVDELKPNEFIMENVPEILEVKDQIVQDFENIGYKVNVDFVKGEEIGLKQMRKRVFFKGRRA